MNYAFYIFLIAQNRMVSPAVALAFLPLLLTLLIKYRFYFVLFYRAVLVRIWKDLASGLSREERAYQYVLTHAIPGDPDSILDAFDMWCSKVEFISNIGPKKGEKILCFTKAFFPEYGNNYLLSVRVYCVQGRSWTGYCWSTGP